MAKDVQIIIYDKEYKERWDRFVLGESVNGNFLQTRNFLEYHPADRFKDNSLIFLNGTNIIAVIPANIIDINNKKILYSHQGSTFGGLIVGKNFCKISYMDKIMEKLDGYLISNNINEIILKQPGSIYQACNSELIDYYLFMYGYIDSQEVGYYIDYSDYSDDIISNLTSSRRRDYRYSLKNDFSFRELTFKKQISEFYDILCDNYKKFDKTPIHSLEEFIEFKFLRLKDNTRFYGVYLNEKMIAGGMVFIFGQNVFHTQYLAVLQDKANIFANEFLYVNIIDTAKKGGFQYMSFGTSTLEGGKILNRPLAMYKEGFGTKEYVNRTYIKRIK